MKEQSAASINECIAVARAVGPVMNKTANSAKEELATLQKECKYRHLAMFYFAVQVDNYSHIGQPNVIGDIIGFWDNYGFIYLPS